MVDPILAELPHVRVQHCAHAVCLIGVDAGTERVARVLRGPYTEHALDHGWRVWQRNNRDEPWIEIPEQDRSTTIVYVDMDDVLCAYTTAHTLALTTRPDVAFPQGVAGFFQSLEPIDGAIAAVNELRKSFDVYVLTAPSTRNAHSYTEKRIWIEEHFDYQFTKKLILSPNKGLLKGDYLVDDHASGKGQDSFEGMLIEFGSNAFPDWHAVLTFLKERGITKQ